VNKEKRIELPIIDEEMKKNPAKQELYKQLSIEKDRL